MTSKTRVSDGENWTYTWDDRNRLTQVVEKTSGGVTVTNDVFTYDVENRRIGKSVNGTQTWYGYDGQNSYADFNGAGSLTMRYLTGQALDSLYARFDGTNTGWYLNDMLGSVRQIVNTSGTVLDALSFNSYGQLLTETNSSNGDRFKYTSREWDSEIGLQFNRARYYDVRSGRWISQDPKRFAAGDANLFRYVANNVAEKTDPSGLWSWELCWHGAWVATSVFAIGVGITLIPALPFLVTTAAAGVFVTKVVFACVVVSAAAGGVVGGLSSSYRTAHENAVYVGVFMTIVCDVICGVFTPEAPPPPGGNMPPPSPWPVSPPTPTPQTPPGPVGKWPVSKL